MSQIHDVTLNIFISAIGRNGWKHRDGTVSPQPYCEPMVKGQSQCSDRDNFQISAGLTYCKSGVLFRQIPIHNLFAHNGQICGRILTSENSPSKNRRPG